MSRRPNFFVIGAPKCGTTSMYEYLALHPQVYMSPVKEPRYFAPDRPFDAAQLPGLNYGAGIDRYLSLFAGAGSAIRLGEASVQYLYSKVAPKLIQHFQPQASIVVMLRNPVDLIHSLHGDFVGLGYEDIEDLAEALAAEPERLRGRRLPPRAAGPRHLQYRARGCFGKHLHRWFKIFGTSRIHVILLEDMLRDPSVVYRDLLDFLAVDSSVEPSSFRIYNERARRRSEVMHTILTARLAKRLVGRVLPVQLYLWSRAHLVKPLHRLNRQPTPLPLIDPEVRRQLESDFAPDVSRVSDLVGRDLGAVWWSEG